MICACDEDFARRFLPHQISKGFELETPNPVLVTIGFQQGLCNSCRGLSEEAHPKAEMYGATSKVERYYWREIYFETTRRFAEWARQEGYTDDQVALKENRRMYSVLRKQVVSEYKDLHDRSPKYTYQEKSQEQVIRENYVELVRIDGKYSHHPELRGRVIEGSESYSAEEYVAMYFRRQGYDAQFVESRPFHAMFAIFMWLLIQDPSDPRVRIVGFGDRAAFDEKRQGRTIWAHLPSDFGTSGYANRRTEAIDKHFLMIPHERQELLQVFDYWLEPSSSLREYLWAYRSEDVERARVLVSLLPIDAIHRILRYLIAGYWRRYTGWPDLVVYKANDYFFAEVKSSKDKLREDQKSWIQGNSMELHLPFKLVKIHKKTS